MWRHVDIVLTDVSEEHITSIFRVEEKEEICERTGPTLKVEAIRSSETSVNIISTWRHIPEDCFFITVNLLMETELEIVSGG
jgi:hypothetical protein